MNRKTKAALGIFALLLLCAFAWTIQPDGVDPEIAALEKQRAFIFSDQATEADREAFRTAVDQLSETQRRQFRERGREAHRRWMERQMNELFRLPPEQLQQEVRDRAAKVINARQNPSANDRGRQEGPPGGRGGPGNGRGDRPPRSEAQRDARRKQRLDRIEPTNRAQFSEFRRMINKELESQGQEPLSRREMRRVMEGHRPG